MTYIQNIVLLFLLSSFLKAQSGPLGNPPLTNYSKQEYKSGTQNWDIEISATGIMYFANNRGLLEFDGHFWKTYPLKNKTNVRSLAIHQKRIYVGGQGELGFFEEDASGILKYHSLLNKIEKKYLNFADVWDIEVLGDAVFFRTEKYMFRLKKDTIDTYTTRGTIRFMGKMKNSIYVDDVYQGLLRFEGENFIPPNFTEKPASPVTAFLPLSQDSVLISTLNHGFLVYTGSDLLTYPTPNDLLFSNSRIYTAEKLSDKIFALSIPARGIVLISKEGEILSTLTQKEGLQNSNILCMKPDVSGNLWLGTDNGIDYLQLNSPFLNIYPDENLGGIGYTAVEFADKFYFGTSNGLYVSDKNSANKSQTFSKIKGFNGQVWGCRVSGQQMFTGMHKGGFVISEDGSVESLPEMEGVWDFIRLNDQFLLAGHYYGMKIFKQEKGEWVLHNEVSNLEESSRLLVQESEHVIWMAHPYRGVYQIEFNDNFSEQTVTHYGAADGLPSDNYNNVFRYRNEVIFGTEQGIYTFDEDEKVFQPAESYQKVLGKFGQLKMLEKDSEGNLWFFAGETCGRLNIKESGLDIEVKPELYPRLSGKLVDGFEFAFPVSDENVYFGAERGFIHLNTQKYEATIDTILASVRSVEFNDSLIVMNSLAYDEQKELVLNHDVGRVKFTFTGNDFNNPGKVLFQTKLEGLTDNWSEWTNKAERDYIKLPQGKYVFKIRAKNARGLISEESEFSFTVLPPWYLSTPAAIVYFGLFFGSLYYFLRWREKKFTVEKNSLQSELQDKELAFKKQVEENELELSKVKQRQLENEVSFKNQELASATLNLVQKREILSGLKGELMKLSEKIRDNSAKPTDVKKLVRLLDNDLRTDDEWKRFAHHFDGVHQGFLSRLKERYPGLSPNDLKLCAYLRMNLSSKEIAPLMAISVRGVEAGRYRLRKKMNLENSQNLRTVILNL